MLLPGFTIGCSSILEKTYGGHLDGQSTLVIRRVRPSFRIFVGEFDNPVSPLTNGSSMYFWRLHLEILGHTLVLASLLQDFQWVESVTSQGPTGHFTANRDWY